jgi:hypothetical protein
LHLEVPPRKIIMMEPFSKFSYLRQAFTRGERWDVPPERLERLLASGRIDRTQNGQTGKWAVRSG